MKEVPLSVAESTPTDSLMGVRIGSWQIDDLVRAVRLARERKGRTPFVFACANPHSLVAAEKDSHFQEALNSFAAVVADGIGILIGARLAGTRVTRRVTGHDFFDAVMADLQRTGGSVFFLGSTDAVLERIRTRAAVDYPDVKVCTHSPPFGDWSDDQLNGVLNMIHQAEADVLWVGMTALRQEKWVQANLERLPVAAIGCVGAVFDYYAGTVVRAPAVWRNLGLEWLYRLAGEPRRLWRRTVVSGPLFLWRCLLQRFRVGRSI